MKNNFHQNKTSLKGFDYYKNFQSFYKLNNIIIKDEIDS